MSALMITSATGAPGVTTTALGLALVWPSDTVLVDADSNPSQAVLAGYLQGTDGAGRGVPALAGEQRDHALQPVEVLSHCLALSSETERQRVFLPGFSRPGSAQALAPALPAIANALTVLAGGGIQVIIDAGRFGPDGPPRDLVQACPTVAVITRTTLRALAGLRLHLPLITRATDPARLGLILIGAGKPYGADEIAEQFAIPVFGALTDDPASASVLSDGRPAQRGFINKPYARSLRMLAETLAAAVPESPSERQRV